MAGNKRTDLRVWLEASRGQALSSVRSIFYCMVHSCPQQQPDTAVSIATMNRSLWLTFDLKPLRRRRCPRAPAACPCWGQYFSIFFTLSFARRDAWWIVRFSFSQSSVMLSNHLFIGLRSSSMCVCTHASRYLDICPFPCESHVQSRSNDVSVILHWYPSPSGVPLICPHSVFCLFLLFHISFSGQPSQRFSAFVSDLL